MTAPIPVKYRPHPKTAHRAPVSGFLHGRESDGIRVKIKVIGKDRYVLVPFERVISIGGIDFHRSSQEESNRP